MAEDLQLFLAAGPLRHAYKRGGLYVVAKLLHRNVRRIAAASLLAASLAAALVLFQQAARPKPPGPRPGNRDRLQAIATRSAEEAYSSGLEAYRNKDYELAVRLLSEAERKGLREPALYYYRGKSQAILDRHAQALADYRRAIAVDPEFPHAYIGRALLLAAHGTDADMAQVAADAQTAARLALDSQKWSGRRSILVANSLRALVAAAQRSRADLQARLWAGAEAIMLLAASRQLDMGPFQRIEELAPLLQRPAVQAALRGSPAPLARSIAAGR